MPRDSHLPVREWLLGYGPAMPRRQFVRLCVLLCVPPASMTLTFALRGYWSILLFVLAEQAVLGAVLLYHLLRRTDYDRIVLSSDHIVIEQGRGMQRYHLRMDVGRTHMAVDRNDAGLIHFFQEGDDVDVELGRYASAARRREVAQELRFCLPATCLRAGNDARRTGLDRRLPGNQAGPQWRC